MKKLSMLAFAMVVAAGCGKKKEEPAAAEKPATPETVTKPSTDTKAETPAAPPAGELEDVKTVAADAPKECQDAYALYNRIHGCNKLDMETRKTLVKSWNLAVTGSIEQLPKADAEQKKSIIDSCAKRAETGGMLAKDCP
jgi:hypothetical protein